MSLNLNELQSFVANKINRLHERCLPIVYSNKKSSCEKLFKRDSSVCIHHQTISFLATEMLFQKQPSRCVLTKRWSVNLLQIFRTPFPQNTSGGMYLMFDIFRGRSPNKIARPLKIGRLERNLSTQYGKVLLLRWR